MTDREKAIVMTYTGVAMLTGDKLNIFYKYIAELMGRPVYTHELASAKIWEELKKRARADFVRLCQESELEAEKKNANVLTEYSAR